MVASAGPGFMTLPPDLRNVVYRHLLTTDTTTPRRIGRCHPQILSTCRRIKDEATSILYEENSFSCDFRSTKFTDDREDKFAVVHTILDPEGHRFGKLPYAIDQYPNFFHRIANLSVHLSARASQYVRARSTDCRLLNNFVAGLAAFLMEGHSLKILTVHVDVDDTVSDKALGIILYPFRHLRHVPSISVKISGRDARAYQEKMLSDQSKPPLYNVQRQLSYLFNHVNAIEQSLSEQTSPTTTKALEDIWPAYVRMSILAGKSALGAKYREYYQAQMWTLAILIERFYRAQWQVEKSIVSAWARDCYLSGVGTAQLKRMANKWAHLDMKLAFRERGTGDRFCFIQWNESDELHGDDWA